MCISNASDGLVYLHHVITLNHTQSSVLKLDKSQQQHWSRSYPVNAQGRRAGSWLSGEALGAPFQDSLDEGGPGLGLTSWCYFGPERTLFLAYSHLRTRSELCLTVQQEGGRWVTSPRVAGAHLSAHTSSALSSTAPQLGMGSEGAYGAWGTR